MRSRLSKQSTRTKLWRHPEKKNIKFRKSLFIASDIKCGENFTEDNVRAVRPGFGLPPKLLDQILGRTANQDLKAGTPLNFSMITW